MTAQTKENAMDVDDEHIVEDFAAAMGKDPDTNEDDGFEFHGFFRPVHTARNEEGDGMGEEGKEEDDSGPLYRMEALTLAADTLMSSPSKASDNFLPSVSEGNKDNLDDLEETPISRKIILKAKVKEVVWVVGKGRWGVTKGAKEMTVDKKTKGALL